MSRDPFFQHAKIWSKRKHRILGKYLKPFSAKVGSRARRIFIVDGFAGCAKYQDGTEGSPLLTSKLSDECRAWQRPVDLRIINVEENPENFSSLDVETASWVAQGITTNLKGEFRKHQADILLQIAAQPAFFFIDPYGPSCVYFYDLEPILKRSPITELMINFDLDGLCRIADTIRMDTSTEKLRKTQKSNVALVDRIMGSAEWLESFRQEDLSRASSLLKSYMERISSLGYKVVSYPIRESFRSKPKYYLIYCTRHPHGVFLMNDFIREEEDELIKEIGRQLGEPLLSEDFHLEPEIVERRRTLKGLVLKYAASNSIFTRGNIINHFMFAQFGDFHTRDYNAVVKDLITEGKLITEHGLKRINDGTSMKKA